MRLLKNFIQQTRKPEGLLGKWMIASMNRGHAKVADWGLKQLNIISPTEIVDLGCGGGRNVAVLLDKYPMANVWGLDYSLLCVEQASVKNQKAIDLGRCIIQQGDVSALSLDFERYDLASAFETIYFWPELERCFAEVAKILRSGGRFLIVNETDGTDKLARAFEKKIDGMTLYTTEKIEKALRQAEFSTVTVYRYPKKPWLCVLAEK